MKPKREMIVLSSLAPVRKRAAKASPYPPTIRERAARGLSSLGHSPSRLEMTPTHTLELIERFPRLYRLAFSPPVPPCEPFAVYGFQVYDGWFAIIAGLSAKLAEDPNVIVLQVKEKYGTLKVHVDPIERFYDERLAANHKSARVCEVCGAPGTLKARLRGWWSVRCESCHWLEDMAEACRLLADLVGGSDLPAFASDRVRPDAARRHLQHLGEAAGHQSKERRALLPAIKWRRLDTFRPVAAVGSLSAAKLWAFIRDEVPALEEALR
jgi:uncharacterized protein with HEPN domain